MTSTAEERARAAFRARFGAEPAVVAHAPGRVNLIGEHVDYNEGFVLPAAIDRAAWVAATAADDEAITLEAVDLGECVRFDLADAGRKLDCRGEPLPGWALYAAGVAHTLATRGFPVRPMKAAFASDVPIGAGLSSSAAIAVALASTWRALGALAIERLELARICQAAECDYVGVRCGLMDQFASIHGVRGHALFLDCRSLAWKPVPLPADTVLVIADSKVRRELAASEFNVRREECERAVEGLRAVLPAVRSLRDVSPRDLERHGERLPEVLRRRARHVVGEIARVEAAIPAVERGDAAALGQAMTAAHQSGRFLYEVSCRELDLLVDTAVALDGCYGSRLTGAGFGGCTVSLVEARAVEEFVARLAKAYRDAAGFWPDVWICRAADGAHVRFAGEARSASMGANEAVAGHYGRERLLESILDALRAAGKDPEQLTVEDLVGFDQFHLGGRDATLELLRHAALESGARVLDVGGGIGGPARTLAVAGCSVTVLDLTEEYCRTGAALSERVGLGRRVTFRHGSALDMPFGDASFDAVWTQHSSMNIEDKERLYGEIARVIRPGGRLAMHEIMAGPEAPPHYPAPWASVPSISFLRPPDALRELLGVSGFRERVWIDVSAAALAWLRGRLAAAPATPPPLGLHLFLGAAAPQMFQNVARSLEERRICVVEGVFERE